MLQSAWQQHPLVPCLFSSPARGAAGTGPARQPPACTAPDKAQAAKAARGVEKHRGGRAERAWPCLLTPDWCSAAASSSAVICPFIEKKYISCDLWICDLVIYDCLEVEEGWRLEVEE